MRLFLSQHFGSHLNDVLGYTKKGKKITVQIACIKKMTKIVGRKARDLRRTVSADALTPASEPFTEIKEETTHDYSQYDSIIKSLNLTDNMHTALECRMAGLSYPEIGRILERAQSTVYEYFIKMRQRYMEVYAVDICL